MNQLLRRVLKKSLAAGKAAVLFLFLLIAARIEAQTNTATPVINTNIPGWVTRPLSLADALNIALAQNGTILKAKSDLEAAYGVVVQTRAIVIPKVRGTADYMHIQQSAVDSTANFSFRPETWSSGVEVVQSVFEGGRMLSSFRTARLTKEQALLQYQTVESDTLLAVRVAYYDALVALEQIGVNEASVNLLSRNLEDQRRRYEAGTVPRFNVLRAEVAVANARPPLIRARNAYRIAKANLSNLLGYDLPREVWEDVPLQLTDRLEASSFQIDLPNAMAQALEKRSELGALRKAEQLQEENVVSARAGYFPRGEAFADYNFSRSQFTGKTLHGWTIGGRMSWNIFDGTETRGKVMEARALHDKSKVEVADTARRIELEVRTSYSTFVEAREVLESQEKVQEEAEEALRLAKARADAGTATQLDVLDAETSLTQARTTQAQALHDWSVARARLERAIGQEVVRAPAK